MMAKTGRFQVPYLVDPNTGVEMYESEEIVKYLEEVYTV
jgi:glutathione S-transferase